MFLLYNDKPLQFNDFRKVLENRFDMNQPLTI